MHLSGEIIWLSHRNIVNINGMLFSKMDEYSRVFKAGYTFKILI